MLIVGDFCPKIKDGAGTSGTKVDSVPLLNDGETEVDDGNGSAKGGAGASGIDVFCP